jgi:hypothetical protein
MDLELRHKINLGEIDVNNQQLFMSTLFRALVHNLNNQITLRDKNIPHFVLNTGDDIMYLENKGQDFSKEPLQISNEDYIYNSIPRCILNMGTIEVLEDQITSPYTRGNFEIEYDDMVHSFNAEFRRMPIKITVDLKYYLDSFTDVMGVTQEIMSKMLFIQNFKFDYMGQSIQASYKVPTAYNNEKNITFDGGTTEQKTRTIELSIEVETTMPVYNERTAIENGTYIRTGNFDLKVGNDIIKNDDIINDRDAFYELIIEMLKKYKDKDDRLRLLLEHILRKLNIRGFDHDFI